MNLLGLWTIVLALLSLPLQTEFESRDVDNSGELTWVEVSSDCPGELLATLRHAFLTFDADQNQELSFPEFRALPITNGTERMVPDPVIHERNQCLKRLSGLLEKYDRNGDHQWALSEWPLPSAWGALISEPQTISFGAWDLDSNQIVSEEELAGGVDLAFGWRDPSHIHYSWRHRNGTVFNGAYWLQLDKNHDRQLSREEFCSGYYLKGDAAETRFLAMDLDHDQMASDLEVFQKRFLISNPVGDFLKWDRNQNGALSSIELTEGLETWRKKLAINLFPGFDTNSDGELSLNEFRMTPIANPVINWLARPVDRNRDGKLNLEEFYANTADTRALWLRGLMRLIFDRFDLDDDINLSSTEFPFAAPSMKVEQQTYVQQDPIRERCHEQERKLHQLWTSVDRNQDGVVTSREWPESLLLPIIPLKEMRDFTLWDIDSNQQLSREEISAVVRQGWGLESRCWPEGDLRQTRGQIVEFQTFTRVDQDHNGLLSQTEFETQFYGTIDERRRWFKQLDVDQNARLTVKELVIGRRMLFSPEAHFRRLDKNGDGQITSAELSASDRSWERRGAQRTLDAFDTDASGGLTTDEFGWTTFANPLVNWYEKRRDTNGDGWLGLDEFYSIPKGESLFWLKLLAHEMYRKWDKDQNGKLTPEEYPFEYDAESLSPQLAFQYLDRNHDEYLAFDEVFPSGKPKGMSTAEVLDHHRRKMRCEEAFLAADLSADRKLTLEEHASYLNYLQSPAVTSATSPRIANVTVRRSWEGTVATWLTWTNIGLAVIGCAYWFLRPQRS